MRRSDEVADLRHHRGDPVGGEGHGLGVEIAAREDLALVGENQGVVRDAVGLALQRGAGVGQHVATGSHHLRLAAQRVGILHALAVEMGAADLASGEQAREDGRDLDLAGLIAGALDARVERHVAAQSGVGAHRSGNQGGVEEPSGLEQAADRECCRHLGAVEQGQALLCREDQRRKTDRGQSFSGGKLVAAQPDSADADQGSRDMGQGCEIARGADRALARDDRQRVLGQKAQEHVDGGLLHAGAAEGEAARLQDQDQPDGGVLQGRTDAAHVREDQPALQLGDVGGCDPHARQLAEARVHAIDRRLAGSRLSHQSRSGVDAGPGCRIKVEPHRRLLQPSRKASQLEAARHQYPRCAHARSSRRQRR